jgi:hypothetical protein
VDGGQRVRHAHRRVQAQLRVRLRHQRAETAEVWHCDRVFIRLQKYERGSLLITRQCVSCAISSIGKQYQAPVVIENQCSSHFNTLKRAQCVNAPGEGLANSRQSTSYLPVELLYWDTS